MSKLESAAQPRVTMVKKLLANGEPCRKCAQAEEMLKRRGVWDRLERVVWADEKDGQSEGMQLAAQYGVALAPFFLVQQGNDVRVETSAIKLVKSVFKPETASPSRSEAQVRTSELDEERVESAQIRLADEPPQAVLDYILGALGKRCALAFSGAEDVVLIDMAVKSGHPFSVFSLDTGRLHHDTYRFIDRVRQHYGIDIQVMSPPTELVEDLVKKKGLFSFYEDGHGECCGIRKVEPLRRALSGYSGWVTGQRRDQSPTRADVPELSWDRSHRQEGMVKANPLATWSLSQVWSYIRQQDLPYNGLHDRGFVSIGCEPCTRAIRPGEHERAGRWWWEEATKRECGLHQS